MSSRRATASTTAAAKAGDTDAGIRTQVLPANSISIAGMGGGAVTLSPVSARITRANPFTARAQIPAPPLGPARHYSCPSRSIPVQPTGALEPFHARLGRRPVSAYGLLVRFYHPSGRL